MAQVPLLGVVGEELLWEAGLQAVGMEGGGSASPGSSQTTPQTAFGMDTLQASRLHPHQDQSAPGEASLAFAQKDSGWKFQGHLSQPGAWSCSPIVPGPTYFHGRGVPLSCFPSPALVLSQRSLTPQTAPWAAVIKLSFAFVRLVLPAPRKV